MRAGAAADRASGAVPAAPEYSPFWRRMFLGYLPGYFARSFTAVRAQGTPPETSKPLIVYSNHPSWWDPIHYALIGAARLPERRVYGPMDAEALEKYRFFKKLGVFPLTRSRRGAAEFLRTSLAILAQPGASLWLTAEGEFTDPRQRPVRIQPGVAHLARRLDDGWVVPLALEYPFWNERRPEALSRFGRALDLAAQPARSVEEWTAVLESRLEETMDRLADDARARDPARFETLYAGRVGVGGVYDLWRRLRAWGRGRSFHAAHGKELR